jgi:HPt (histidine-containing phosphotransfer) domain-containing protein
MSEKVKVLIDKDIEEIVPIFLDNRQKDLLEIETNLSANNLTVIEVIAHKLAGNAGSYGFSDMGLIGADMEAACQNQNIDEVKNLFDKYKNYLNNLVVEYK